MTYKTPDFSDSKGKTTKRPKGQDIVPKAFKYTAMTMIQMFDTPTERRMLWIIHHYPYIFNPFFNGDLLNVNPKMAEQDSKLELAIKVLRSLKMKGYVRQSKDNLKWYVTKSGYFYRLTTYSAWPVIALVFAAIVAFTIFGLNKGCTK